MTLKPRRRKAGRVVFVRRPTVGMVRFAPLPAPWSFLLFFGVVLQVASCELIVDIDSQDMNPHHSGDGGQDAYQGPDADLRFCGMDCRYSPCIYQCDVGSGENCETCGSDCGPCSPTKGDGYCGLDENPINDPEDCRCGNGRCDWYETCATCPGDCGNCVCTGHTDCLTREDLQLCPTLCHGCGDGHCAGAEGESNAGAEDCRTCPEDCGVCFCHNLPQDGQGSCSEFDGYEQCPLLCFCGNGTCDMDEYPNTCPADCSD